MATTNHNQSNQSNPRRRQDDVTLQIIADNMQLMHEDVSELRNDMKESLKDISAALVQLCLVEERQEHHKLATAKLEQRIDAIDARVDVIEKEQPQTKLVTGWIIKAAMGILSIVGLMILKSVGVF